MWKRVARRSELKEGRMIRLQADGEAIAIAIVRGDVFALGAKCPHKGGPLDQGELTKDGRVRCPWHRYEFDLRTGRPMKITYPASYGKWRNTGDLKVFRVKLSGAHVLVDI